MTGSPYTQIAYEVADRVATITLDRPDRLNAFTFHMYEELVDAFDRIDADDDVRVVVVTGRGRGFCAGADLGGGGGTFNTDRAADTPQLSSFTADGRHRDEGGLVSLRIFRCTKPVIAAFNGPAVGVGVTMTLPMDIRLAGASAKFGFVFARRGIVPEAASSWFLPRLVGISRATEWTYTGRVFGSDEALEGGLVRSVHPDDELLPAAYALAAEIAENTSAASVALTRAMLWRMLGEPHPMAAHQLDSRVMDHMGASADAQEGVRSFLEKRPANFTMRPSTDLPDWYPWWQEPEF
ncbi:MAG: enoyl-CoA hydratase-related protein [Acidimicrobiales bacterium]